jgi:hypothetical protein
MAQQLGFAPAAPTFGLPQPGLIAVGLVAAPAGAVPVVLGGLLTPAFGMVGPGRPAPGVAPIAPGVEAPGEAPAAPPSAANGLATVPAIKAAVSSAVINLRFMNSLPVSVRALG